MQVDGRRTLHENIADGAAYKAALHAFASTVIEENPEPRLIHFETFSSFQLLTLAFVNVRKLQKKLSSYWEKNIEKYLTFCRRCAKLRRTPLWLKFWEPANIHHPKLVSMECSRIQKNSNLYGIVGQINPWIRKISALFGRW